MAAKPYAYNRLRFGGPTANGPSWSIGLGVITSAAISSGALSTWLAGIATDVAGSWEAETSNKWGGISKTGTKLAYMEAYHYPSGSVAASDMGQYLWGTPISGVGSGDSPDFTTMCVSLLTGHPGRKFQGRVYVPGDAATMAGGRFSLSQMTLVVNGIRSLIDHINGSSIAGEDATVVVAGETAATPVTLVRADNRVDTQRPRQGDATSTFSDNV